MQNNPRTILKVSVQGRNNDDSHTPALSETTAYANKNDLIYG